MTERCDDLDLFFDRELEPEARRRFRDHLAVCARCQNRAARPDARSAVAAPCRRAPRSPSSRRARCASPPPSTAARRRDCPTCQARRPRAHRAHRFPITGYAIVATPSRPPLRCCWMMCGSRRRTAHRCAAWLGCAGARGRAVARQGARRRGPGSRPRRSITTAVQRHARGRRTPSERIGAPRLRRAGRSRRAQHASRRARPERRAHRGRTRADSCRDTVAQLVDRAAVELLQLDTRPTQTLPPPRASRPASAAPRSTLRAARWNKRSRSRRSAGAGRRAGLDETVAAGEPGWADEARAKAGVCGSTSKTASEWNQLPEQRERMVLGGPVLAAAQ